MIASDPGRMPRGAVGGVVLLALLEATLLAIVWPTIADANDIVGFLTGARALLAGADLYDPATWSAWPHAVGQRPDTAVFGYPPWIAVAFIPLALLPTRIASLIWTAGTLALAAIATMRFAARWGWPAPLGAVLAVASWPALLQFFQGQWGFALVALALACVMSIAARHDARAGVAWAAMLLAKPQLVALASVVFALWAIRERLWRAPLAALATLAVAVAIGTAAAPGWLVPYVRDVLLPRSGRSTMQPTLAGVAGDAAGPLWPVAWVALVVALGLLVALAVRHVRGDERLPLAFAGVLALSVAAAPYSWSYDQYLVIPLAVATIGIAGALPRGERAAVVVAVALLLGPLAFLLFESAYLRWHDTLAGLVPPLAIVLAYVASSLARRRVPTA